MRRPSWKINVSATTNLQYDIISGDKLTRAWIHKSHRFLREFQEIKHIEKTEISIVDASETNQNIINEPQHDKTNKTTSAPSKDLDQPGRLPSLISLCCALIG